MTARPLAHVLRIASLPLSLVLTMTAHTQAQGRAQGEGGGRGQQWDVTQARGKTRDIDFTTSKARGCRPTSRPTARGSSSTCSATSIACRRAAGEATVLTQNSGVALNFQPRISPTAGPSPSSPIGAASTTSG